MKPARTYPQITRRFYRPEVSHCADCQKRLRRAVTLSERTVITLQEVIKLVHAGYRCPDAQCVGHQRTYRSVRADALALPRFTYGLDVVLLVGRLRLVEYRTVDEIHRELLARLEPSGAAHAVSFPSQALFYAGLARSTLDRGYSVGFFALTEKKEPFLSMALGLPSIYLAKNSFNYFANLIPYLPLSHDAFSLLLFFARFLLDALCLSLPYTPPSPPDLPLLFLSLSTIRNNPPK